MYGLCGIVGALIAGFLFCRMLSKRGRSDMDGLLMLLSAGAGSVIGSHLLYGLTHLSDWWVITKTTTFDEALYVLFKLFGGAVFYGGLLGGLAGGFLYIKLKGLDVADYSDCGGICIPLFHSFARVGCFFAGCCYGIECEWGFASAANEYVPAVVGVTRFPTPLLEAGLNLILFVVLFSLRKKEKLHGMLLSLYLLIYSVIRFCDEFLRGDLIRGIWFGLSTSQWISIGIFIVSAWILIRKALKQKNAAEK